MKIEIITTHSTVSGWSAAAWACDEDWKRYFVGQTDRVFKTEADAIQGLIERFQTAPEKSLAGLARELAEGTLAELERKGSLP